MVHMNVETNIIQDIRSIHKSNFKSKNAISNMSSKASLEEFKTSKSIRTTTSMDAQNATKLTIISVQRIIHQLYRTVKEYKSMSGEGQNAKDIAIYILG